MVQHQGLPYKRIAQWENEEEKGLLPTPCLGSCPVCCVKAVARPHTSNKWHTVCSLPKRLEHSESCGAPFCCMLGFAGEGLPPGTQPACPTPVRAEHVCLCAWEAWASGKKQGETWLLSWLFLLRSVLLGADTGGLVTIRLSWQKRHCFSN